MTPELQHRLDCSMSPFDGVCVHNSDDLKLAQLRELLGFTIVAFKDQYPAIQSFHDWHEHDGFIVESKPDTWDFFNNAIRTDRVLFDSRDEDFAVRIAICPPNFDWLVRYKIDQEDESDYNTATCDFDVSVAKNTNTSGLIDKLLTRFPNVMTRCESQPWFSSNYGG